MRFLVDEHLPVDVADVLRREGHDVAQREQKENSQADADQQGTRDASS